MNRSLSPLAKVSVLLAAAAAASPAAALPPTRVRLVDDAVLAGLSGKYLGANMLVGVRVDLVSRISAPLSGSADAAATLHVRRNGDGFDVTVASQASAQDSGGAAMAPNAKAAGGDAVDVAGIAQVAQIAGSGNRLGNLAAIAFVPADLVSAPAPGDPAGSGAVAGGMSAHVTFLDGGVQLGVDAPGASLVQNVAGTDGRILQSGRIAGHGVTASNTLQLQVMTAAMPASMQQNWGVLQALNGLCGVPR